MLIGGFQKFSMIDYPEKISAIVFTSGCNFRCPFCHNPELVLPKKDVIHIQESDFFKFLKSRIGQLDAVVVSGGEPTIQTDIIEFTQKIKDLGFLIKLDTNGARPDVIKNMLDKNLLDYIAMDIKTTPKKYELLNIENFDFKNIKESINLIINANIDYEFRTTVVKPLIEIYDFEEIGKIIEGANKYYLQKFVSSKHIDENYLYIENYTDKELIEFVRTLKQYIKNVYVR